MNLKKIAAATLTAGLLALSQPVAYAGDLNQVVTADEPVAAAGTLTEFRQGHADLGPLVTPDGFAVMVRDDTAAPPTWRGLDDTLFVVSDKAIQQLPQTEDFDFVGAQPGEDVWVVPQTEQAGVPWLGWSTQSPPFVEAATRGVTMTFLGHDGPGQFTLFLQNGGFEKPQLLWTSAQPHAQDLFVDLNTHTHANWVFTEPGIHHVAVKFTTEFQDGTTHDATQTLSFAVGEGVDLAKAQESQFTGEYLPAGDGDQDTDAPQTQGDSQWVLWAIIAVVGLLIVVVLGVVVRLLVKKKES
ncbi:hypothetical protein CPHO_02290 [Corynebacterium phocae]|uniref:Peptidase n=1 Tax=Corynebacterium phocae TaxID=161895 RepID=A0A1L7D1N1_9CORY|nr:choice-of-anchor M domain-containing protein [Corynebacterium phocae]APT91932.1 hypothetical protein CPHO_02290 [Corynebacterium phocae]KAA8726914.1 peptidase [Corynebacterium phocae]